LRPTSRIKLLETPPSHRHIYLVVVVVGGGGATAAAAAAAAAVVAVVDRFITVRTRGQEAEQRPN